MTLLDKIKQKFGKKEEWIPFQEGKEFLSQIGIDISILNLPEAYNTEYEKAFRNLKAWPYMDVNELKIRVTGEYVILPKNARFVEGRYVPGTPTRTKIDTFGRIPELSIRALN